MKKIGIIGAGNMASAIIDSAINCGFLSAVNDLMVYDVNSDKCSIMQAKGATIAPSIEGLVQGCKFILLSVKPQVAPSVLEEASKSFSEDNILISIAAGMTAQAISEFLHCPDAKIILVMPNTPIMVGEGAAAICHTPGVTYDELAFGKGLFSAGGIVEEVSPNKMNEVIAVHGSTPAYIYLITKYFCEYAAEHGIPMETANRLFCQTLIGSAKMMTETGQSHQQLIDMVSSPGGTTLAGLASLEASHIREAIDTCCDATIKRAYELGKK